MTNAQTDACDDARLVSVGAAVPELAAAGVATASSEDLSHLGSLGTSILACHERTRESSGA